MSESINEGMVVEAAVMTSEAVQRVMYVSVTTNNDGAIISWKESVEGEGFPLPIAEFGRFSACSGNLYRIGSEGEVVFDETLPEIIIPSQEEIMEIRSTVGHLERFQLADPIEENKVSNLNLFATMDNGKIKVANEKSRVIGILIEEPDVVGMIGTMKVKDDGTCVVGGLCKCGPDGRATVSNSTKGYVYYHRSYDVLERIGDDEIRILFK